MKTTSNLTFLFQGDSITDGNWGRNGDLNHILGHGYCYSVSSRIGADFPQAGFQFINRGVSGNTVVDLERRWQEDALDLKPDVLSLLIGVNDVGAFVEGRDTALSNEDFEATYRSLLTALREQNPDLLIIMGLPFYFTESSQSPEREQRRSLTLERAEIVRRIAPDFDAVLIDYPKLFEEALKQAPADYWIWDGVHPTVFGHELMAREWIKQASTRLDFLKIYLT